MGQITLRRYLQQHTESRFIFHGRVVDAQELADHYSAYLDAQVTTEGSWVFFLSVRRQESTPFACRVPAQRHTLDYNRAA